MEWVVWSINCAIHVDPYFQYITWLSDNKPAWTIRAGGVGADNMVDISARPVSQEPMVRHVPSTKEYMLTAS